ncbi:amidohydrolase family protein [Microbacterium enclense]|uniref:Predicted metal-dependent hydrolase, TIM-barrel fold n=1 Tax=Microbacterium enclense TaxID=993073 RepID=A0A1G6R4E6_9MICO|nr:amidohydrolase family protein [Microbacterium enclense]KSU51739.1 hypothetical protein AS029_15840 [Microbacterium enclense]SDC99529.1 Predicted metal-dependent hydrolase, TIM-barrel fold [Microbacterium enclense]
MPEIEAHGRGDAIDTHVHVFDPARFPYASPRNYTPAEATVSHLRDHLRRVDAARVVLVQPSVYGADNATLLDALNEFGSDARAVAVIDESTTPSDIDILKAAGVVGLRLNVRSNPDGNREDIAAQLADVLHVAARHDLFVEIFASAVSIGQASDVIARSPVPILLDHYGGVHAHGDDSVTGLLPVAELLGLGHVWVKLSADYRVGRKADTEAVLPGVVRHLLEVRTDRLVWGSDWPHTGGGTDRKARGPYDIEPFRSVDSAADLNALRRWIADASAERAVLTENAERLYNFAPADATAPLKGQ